jgi:macrophage erythroblast attacher
MMKVGREMLMNQQSNLEFMLRFQQYIELVRTQNLDKLLESIAHAKKYLIPFRDSYPKEVQQACGLLAFLPGTRVEQYSVSPHLNLIVHSTNIVV